MKTDFQRQLPTRAAHALFFAGIAAMVAGSWMVYRPAGAIVAGLFSGWIAFLISAEVPK